LGINKSFFDVPKNGIFYRGMKGLILLAETRFFSQRFMK